MCFVSNKLHYFPVLTKQLIIVAFFQKFYNTQNKNSGIVLMYFVLRTLIKRNTKENRV